MATNATDFMAKLHDQLVTGDNAIAKSSAAQYMRSLMKLNGERAFTSLAWLRDREGVKARIDAYERPATRKAMVAAVLSVLKRQTSPIYKRLYKDYNEVFLKAQEDLAEERRATAEGGSKTEREAKNWEEWQEVQKKREELGARVASFPAGALTTFQYQTLLDYIVLSLYTLQPPRRNKDYTEMYIIRAGDATEAPKDRNYLEVRGGEPSRWVFNVFKTAKKHGQQVLDVPEALVEPIKTYLARHPLLKVGGRAPKVVRFLVTQDGNPFNQSNGMTRILNRIFKKKIGSSMLRHIYLSDKYDRSEMEATAEAMGHTMSEQRDYLRNES